MDIIPRKENKDNPSVDVDNKGELEVAGSESTMNPLISFGDDESDMSLIDQLYRPKHRPLMGEASLLWE